MRLSYTDEKIVLEFEEPDWSDPKGGVRAIQEVIKKYIGPGEYGFDFDPRLNLWIVDKNAYNQAVLKKTFELYLTRPPKSLDDETAA